MNDSKHPCRLGPERSPCRRIRPGEAFDIDKDCALCWKFAHDVRYNLAWGGDGKVVSAPETPKPVSSLKTVSALKYNVKERRTVPCRYLGDFTGETRDCAYCGGGKNIPLRQCQVHGQCTTERKLGYRNADGTWAHVALCLSCADYEPREKN